jgi:hypothetical protein
MFAEEQEELRRSITEDDVINWDIASSGVNPHGARSLRLVAGVDLSFYEVGICFYQVVSGMTLWITSPCASVGAIKSRMRSQTLEGMKAPRRSGRFVL